MGCSPSNLCQRLFNFDLSLTNFTLNVQGNVFVALGKYYLGCNPLITSFKGTASII